MLESPITVKLEVIDLQLYFKENLAQAFTFESSKTFKSGHFIPKIHKTHRIKAYQFIYSFNSFGSLYSSFNLTFVGPVLSK